LLKKSVRIFIVLLIATLLYPSGVFAYSYGDPSKDDVAETFKLILVRLNNDSPDWSGAQEAYKVRRAEISSHFGESIAVTLDTNFEDKNKELLVDNYKALLVMNIKRRFDYAEKDINDYSKTKILLAKAKGTYDTIQPYVQELAPNETQNLQTAFEKALEALGNPGLFGVGEKPVQPEEFKKQASYIIETITPLFPYTEAKKKSEDSQSTPTTEEKKSTTASTTDTDKSSSTTEESSSSEQESDSTESSTNESTEKDSEEAQTESKTEETSTNDSEEETKFDSEKKNEQPSEEIELSESKTDIAEIEVAKEESTKAHDPMERNKKTNTATSFIVITLVASLGIGSIVFLRKKGFI
jgi:cobalamin biosynthesis Mg chelatase CobN